MLLAEPVAAAGWCASLSLGFERRADRTVLAAKRHEGPLLVQKPLYPEGGAVCHAIVVHPPGGVAGGDALEIALDSGPGAHALLTTPGAGKWYRSSGAEAAQAIEIQASGTLEWLPQESIVFDGALARMQTRVRLARQARYIGWEIVCLGRSGSGERFARGACRIETRLEREQRLLYFERASIEGGAALLRASAGLAGHPVFGTLLASAPGFGRGLVDECRRQAPAKGEGAVTLLPGVLVARYLGGSSEAAKRYFTALWGVLRPALAGREACEPRIWRT